MSPTDLAEVAQRLHDRAQELLDALDFTGLPQEVTRLMTRLDSAIDEYERVTRTGGDL